MGLSGGGFAFLGGGHFFGGHATLPSTEVPARWPVAIAGRGYDIEPRLYRRTFVDVQRPAQDQAPEPGEASLSPEGMWRRSQSDWSLGAGQTWLDEEESVRRRFRTSLGVEVFNDRELCLLPDTEEKRTSGNNNLKMLRVGDHLYIADGNNVLFSDAISSEQAGTWAFTTATGLPASTVLDITFSGSHVYVLMGDFTIYRATPGTTGFTSFYNSPSTNFTRIYAALGRLFASVTNTLFEITATPGETLIFTHPDPNYTFSSLCGAPTGVYFAGNIGSYFGELRHTWVRDDGAAFVAPVVVAEYINETINVCRAIGDVQLIGTSRGLRMAQIQGATTGLSFGPPITDFGSVTSIVFDTFGDTAEVYAWVSWTNIEPGLSGCGKVRVSRFTETLVPAYASDVYASTGGTILSIASIRGRRYFAASTDGFYGATGNLVESGTLSTGRIRYGILETKTFASLKWRTAPLEGSLSAVVGFDTGTIAQGGTQGSVGTVGTDGTNLGPVLAEYAEITFTLERDTVDATIGPCLRWWLLRSIANPEGSQRFLVPIRIANPVQPPLGPGRQMDVRSEIAFLASLIRSRHVVKYQEGIDAYDVFVVNMEQRPEQWADLDHLMEGILLVEMQEVV